MYLHMQILLRPTTNIVLDNQLYSIFKLLHKKRGLHKQIHKYVSQMYNHIVLLKYLLVFYSVNHITTNEASKLFTAYLNDHIINFGVTR